MAIINFQAETETQATNFDDFSPIPAGKYKVIAEEITVGQTKSGTGEYLKCKFRVCPDQPYNNRIIWTYINFKNQSPKAEQIGRAQLTQFMRAAGKEFIRDTDELLNIPVEAQVGIREASGNYDATNTIKSFAPLGSGAVAGGVQKPSAVKKPVTTNISATSAPTSAPRSSTPPWATASEEPVREEDCPF